MKQDKKLTLGMAILFFITFVSLGTLIVTEKLAPYYTDKIQVKMNTYLNKKYSNEIKDLNLEKISYHQQIYSAKVTNKKNKDLYFTITYKNKKIKDTYKKDYLEGKTILSKLENNLEKEIKAKLNIKATISFPLPLNKYTNKIRNDIINNNINELNIYNIKLFINSSIKEENSEDLIIAVEDEIKKVKTLGINPNHYTIKISNSKKTSELTIKNLTDKTLEKEFLTQLINYIMIEKKDAIMENIMKKNHISYKYIRYGDE